MKTYQEYYNEWENTTESRDLSFEEWLMLQLARKEKQMIDKSCEWLKENARHLLSAELRQQFRKAMEG